MKSILLILATCLLAGCTSTQAVAGIVAAAVEAAVEGAK